MSSCVSGCVIRGQHLVSCADEECKGCVPRPAEVGRLCQWCWQSLVGAVVDVPTVTAHLAYLARPALSSPSGKTDGGGGAPGPRILYPPELDAADELVGALGVWVEEIVAEHPAHLLGPSQIGWRWSRPGVQVLHGEEVSPDPVPLGASQEAVEATQRWIMPHLRWVADQEWAGEMRAELSRMVATIRARWPWEERPHVVPMPCPSCGCFSLTYHPPSVEHAPQMVTCDSPECGRQWVDDTWTRLVSMALESSDRGKRVRHACA